MTKENKAVEMLIFYVLVSSAINIIALFMAAPYIREFISMSTIDLILFIFLVNMSVVLFLNDIYRHFNCMRYKAAKKKNNNVYKKTMHC